MRYLALACDYDGTLAAHGRVDEPTLATLGRLRATGRRLVLVTGRRLDDLQHVFPHLDLFDRVVAENGALLFHPAARDERTLADPPPPAFALTLTERGVQPLAVGRVIIATWEPHETTVLSAIRDLGLELQVIFNKGAVMILPSGVNKATGLQAALAELGLSPHNAVGVGDAENDHAFLSICESAVAVANALPMLKERSDWVTGGDHGAGVVELIEALIDNDLKALAPRLDRHNIVLGTQSAGEELKLPAFGVCALLGGASGSGKSTLASGVLERIGAAGYQFCIIDPEGDYSPFDGAIVLGDREHAPSVDGVLEVLATPVQNVAVNLLAMKLEQRPAFFEGLLPRLQELRARTGRPHWIVVDEAHHVMPATWDPGQTLPQAFVGILLVTVHPDHLPAAVLTAIDTVLAVGPSAEQILRAVPRAAAASVDHVTPLRPGEALVWSEALGRAPIPFRIIPPEAERRRHRRKYAEGELGEDRSFFFRGPEGKLNLRAHNLTLFMQLAEGIDDDTWLHHLRRGDYSRWFEQAIKDEELAAEVQGIEAAPAADAAGSRVAVRAAIERRYTLPA
jgi:hydroxymethylpyrimidine pyrophosphatase-like HAD family hydrolase